MSRANSRASKKSIPPRTKSASERAHELHLANQLSAAEAQYRRALELDEERTDVLLGLSLLLMQTDRSRQAAELLQLDADLLETSAPLLTNLGEAYRRIGRREDAVASFRRAVSLQPELTEACLNLGVVLQELGDRAAGLEWLGRAVSLAPEQAAMQASYAEALWSDGQHGRALGHYQAAVNAHPRSPELRLALARALHAMGLHEGAIAMCARALEVDPQCVDAHVEQGRALLLRERVGEAEQSLRKALALDGQHFWANFLYTNAGFVTGRVEAAIESCRTALAVMPERATHSNLVFASSFHPALSAQAILAEARGWARTYADPLSSHIRPHTHDADPHRRLRVGYVSPDFWDHCQAMFMMPLMAAHDRTQVEVVCYASVSRPDPRTEQLRARADEWVDALALDDLELAERIRSDRIDVLIDLTMHMAGNRLRTFACRPAPVQISWLAYPGTTGLSQVDYRISDRHLDPPSRASVDGEPQLELFADYSEPTLILPDTFWCYDPLADELEVSALPALERGQITFGCLNNFAKVNARVLALWARVLHAVPTSRLLLRAPPGEPRNNALSVLRRAGVDAGRVEFVARQARAAYLATYRRIDLCLDTFPYNGHTTSLDAQWMGVPVITLVGETVVGRAGLSQAHNLDLTSFVAHDEDAFVEIATTMTRDLERLSALRAGLRTRMQRSPLMDAQRFARNLEHAYRLGWRTWCAAQAP